MKGKTFRKCMALFLALTMTLSINVTGFAAQTSPVNVDEELEVLVEENALQPMEYINVGSGKVYDPENPNYVPEGVEMKLSDEVVAQLMQKAEDICVSAKSSGSSRADIVFVIDTTGSMSSEIRDVKENLTKFVTYMASEGINARFGIITYRDITCDGMDSTVVFKSGVSGTTWYTSPAETIETLNAITVGGGGDTPETLYDALGYLADGSTYAWGSNSTRCSIVLTDADSKAENRWDGSYVRSASSVEEINVGASLYSVEDVMVDMANKLLERGIVCSVITSTYYFEHYSPLVTITGGVLGDMRGSYDKILYDMTMSIKNHKVDSRTGVYVIPGFLGSNLYKKDGGGKVWLDATDLGADIANSEFDSEEEFSTKGILCTDEEGNRKVIADATKDDYGPMDTYEKLVKKLESDLPESDYQVKFFPYDWLSDMDSVVSELESDIVNSGYKDVILVTHSTGGLVAASYVAASKLNQRKVKKLVLVAPPLFGTYASLKPLEEGSYTSTMIKAISVIPRFKKWLKASFKNTSIPYQLLPSKEYFDILPASGVVDDTTSHVTSISDFYEMLKNSAVKLHNNLIDGETNSHKSSRDLFDNQGGIRSVLNKVDTSIVYNSYGYNTPTSVAVTNVFGTKKYKEIIMSKYGDGTVSKLSAAMQSKGRHDSNIKFYDMYEKDATLWVIDKKTDHTDLVKNKDSVAKIVDIVKEKSDEVESVAMDVSADIPVNGVSDSIKLIVANNQDTDFVIVNSDDEVVAKMSDAEKIGFDESDNFEYNLLSDEAGNKAYQIQLPNEGYKVKIYNTANRTPLCNIAIATLTNSGYRNDTAVYSTVTGCTDDTDEKLITTIDLTEKVTDETISDRVESATVESIENAKNDWTITEDLYLSKGEEKTIAFEGKDKEYAKTNVTWYSSDEDVATVTAGGTVKAVNYGEATIYAISNDGNGKAEACYVKVCKYPDSASVDDFTMYVGERIMPEVTFTPADTNMTYMKYETDDRNIVKVINNNTLVAVGTGNVTITGTTENDKKVEFVVTVISSDDVYVEDVHIDPEGAVLPADSTSTITAKIVPDTAIVKDVTWSVEDESVASLTIKSENSCEIKGLKEGATKLSAVTKDGSYYAESYIVVGSVVDIRQSNRMIMPVGKAKQLVLGNGNRYFPIVSSTSSDEEVVTISGNGAIYAAKPGSSVVTFEGELKGERVVSSVQIDVVSSMSDAVKNVYLETQELTSNVYAKESGTVRVLLDLSKDVMLAPGVQSIAMAIQDAKFADASVAAMFDLEPISDSVLKVKPKMSVTDEAVKALAKFYESAVEITVDGKKFTTADKVKINIDKKKAKVKVNPVTVNTYYSTHTVKVPVTTSVGKVTSIKFDPATASKVPSNLKADEENCAIKYTGGTIAKNSSFNILVSVDELREPVSVLLKVKAARTVPKVKLSTTKVEVFKDIAYNVGQDITLMSSNKKITLEDLQVAGISLADPSTFTEKEAKKYKINNEYKVSGFDVEEGVFKLKPSSADGIAKEGSLLLKVNFYGTKDYVTVPLNVKVKDTVKFTLKTKSLKFNKAFNGVTSYSVGYKVSPADYNQKDIRAKAYTSSGADASEDIGTSIVNGFIRVAPKSYPANKKYKVEISDGYKIAATTINVSLDTYRKYGASLSKSGKINISDPEGSGLTVKASLKNILADKSQITFEPSILRYKSRYSYENLSSGFKCTILGNGSFKVSIDTNSDLYKSGRIVNSGKYKMGGMVYVNGRYVGSIKAKLITVSCSKKTVELSTKDISLTENNTTSPVPVTARIDGIDPAFVEYEVNNSNARFCLVEPKGDGTFYVTVDPLYTKTAASGVVVINAKVKGAKNNVGQAKIKVNFIK